MKIMNINTNPQIAEQTAHAMVTDELMLVPYCKVDMMDDAEKFEMWYSKDFDEYRLAIQYNLGVQFAFADELVVGGIA